MRGILGGLGTQAPSAHMPISAEQALQYARGYLDAYAPGTQVADEAGVVYGNYTIHVLNDSEIYGMLSVNGYDEDVWHHDWHGQYVGMFESHESETIY